MKTFHFEHAGTVDDAISSVAASGGKYFAGGTNLLDLMKGGVEAATGPGRPPHGST